jgi:gliding motility-associated-like protein
VAAFAADTNQGCQPFYATFLDESTLPLPYLIIGWEWDFGDGSSPVSSQYCSHTYDDPNLDALSSGLYDISLTVTSANGCMDDTTVAGYIQTWPKPEALFTVDREVADIIDPRFEFTDHSTPNVVQWHWDFGDGVTGDEQNPEHIYQDTISYNIIELVTTDHGCTDTAMYSVEVKPVYTFYMPNCFTPDADAVNATWEPKGTGVKEYHLQIFDRWGERLYESFRLEDQWDGSFKGQQVQNGNYSYIIEVRNVLSEVYHYKGNIRLIR